MPPRGVPQQLAPPRGLFVEFIYNVQNFLLDIATLVLLISRVPLAVYLVFSASMLLFKPTLGVAKASLCAVFPTAALCRTPILVTNNISSPLCVGATGLPFLDTESTSSPTLDTRLPFLPFGFVTPARVDAVVNQMLSQYAISSQPTLGLRSAELALEGLSTLVEASNLMTKGAMVQSLHEFTVHARATSHGLQRLSSKLRSVMDDILAFSKFAARKLQAEEGFSTPDAYDTFTRTFQSSMHILSSEVARLILEGAMFTEKVEMLEAQLTAIGSLASQERALTLTTRNNKLWRYLGGSRATAAQRSRQLSMLKNVDHRRTFAAEHIVAAMEVLVTVEANLMELREKLVAAGYVNEIPLEVHIASINTGARRLKERLGVDRWQRTIASGVKA